MQQPLTAAFTAQLRCTQRAWRVHSPDTRSCSSLHQHGSSLVQQLLVVVQCASCACNSSIAQQLIAVHTAQVVYAHSSGGVHTVTVHALTAVCISNKAASNGTSLHVPILLPSLCSACLCAVAKCNSHSQQHAQHSSDALSVHGVSDTRSCSSMHQYGSSLVQQLLVGVQCAGHVQ